MTALGVDKQSSLGLLHYLAETAAAKAWNRESFQAAPLFLQHSAMNGVRASQTAVTCPNWL